MEDKKKAEEIVNLMKEAMGKAREQEFNLGNKEETSKFVGEMVFTEGELAIIGIAILEKMDGIFANPPESPIEMIENLSQLPLLDGITKKITKALEIE